MVNCVAPPPRARICADEQPSCWNRSVRRYLSIEVIDANAGFGPSVHEVGLTTTGASVLLPPNVNVPPKFCGEIFEILSSRRRAPNLHKCCLAAIEVLFCNSKLF